MQSAEPGGAASVGTLANSPVLPVCDGSAQDYVIDLTTLDGPMSTGSATYTATLYAASTQPWPNDPGTAMAEAGPATMSIDALDLPPANTPSVVTDTVVGLTTSSLTLSWGVPVSNGGEDISAYDVACQTCLPGASGLLVSGTSVTFQNLNSGQQYVIEVSAINGSGDGPALTVAAVIPLPVPPGEPGPVNDLQAVTTAAHLITMSWTPPSDTDDQPVTGYVVGRDGSDTNGYGQYSNTLPASARSFTFSSLFAGTTYALTVTPITSVGQGTSKTISVTTAAPVSLPTAQVVTITASPQSLHFHQSLTLSVAVRPAHSPQVLLEFLSGGSWQKGALLPVDGRYGYSYEPFIGTYTFRAVALASPGFTQGISPSVTVRVLPDLDISPLSCTASVSNAHPKKGATIKVRVATVANAHVEGTARLGATSVTHRATANSKGVASIRYRTSRSIPARPVLVSISVTIGQRAGTCTTSFTPKS